MIECQETVAEPPELKFYSIHAKKNSKWVELISEKTKYKSQKIVKIDCTKKKRVF